MYGREIAITLTQSINFSHKNEYVRFEDDVVFILKIIILKYVFQIGLKNDKLEDKMKKSLVTILVVLSMLTMFVGTVGAAPQMSVTFLEGIWTGHGVNFKFKVDENLGGGWLAATVSWDGRVANMSCVQKVDIVTCTGPKTAADKNIVVSFQGFSFSTFVKSRSFCYSVYDWDHPGYLATWVNYGDYCQEAPADYGDVIEWYNPVWDSINHYKFLPASPDSQLCRTDPVNGDAYYNPYCPPKHLR